MIAMVINQKQVWYGGNYRGDQILLLEIKVAKGWKGKENI